MSGDGNGHPHTYTAGLDAHNPTSAAQAHLVPWVNVFQHQGELHALAGTKALEVSKNTPQALRSRVTAVPSIRSTGSTTRKRCARRLSCRSRALYIGIIYGMHSRPAL
jgi:hypothetical protein